MDKPFFILSLKHSEKDSPTFWRPDNAGYTIFPWSAGLYSKAQVESDPGYYNDGYNTLAIEVSNKGLESMGFKCKMDLKKVKALSSKRLQEIRKEAQP